MKNWSVVKFTILSALILAVPTALIVWKWGLRMQVTTSLIASTSEFSLFLGAPADHISMLPDGSFLAFKDGIAVYQCAARSNGLEWRPIFDLRRIANHIERKQSPTSPLVPQSYAVLEVEPVVFPDASRIVVYHWGVLARFPHDWAGKDDDVQITPLNIQGNHVPSALVVVRDTVVVAYHDGVIEFRDPTNLGFLSSSRVTNSGSEALQVANPSRMKASGDLLAVASIQNSRITFLNVQNIDAIKEERVVRFPTTTAEYFQLDVSDKGRIAVGVGAKDVYVTAVDGSGDAYTPWPSYGTVRAISFVDNNHVVVGGDFQHIYLLAHGEAPAKIADAEKGVGALAVSSNRLAYSSDKLVLMSYVTRTVPNKLGFGAFFGLLLATMFANIGAQRLQAQRYSVEASLNSIFANDIVQNGVPAGEPEFRPLPIPTVPPELVKAVRDGECVLYCGSGVSAQAGFPYWQPFVEDLTDWVIQSKFVDAKFGASLRAALAQDQYDSVSDNLVSIMRGREPELNKYLRRTFTKETALPASLRLLKDLPFSGAMTTNFDNLLEQAFSSKVTSAFTPEDAEPLLECLQKRVFFLLKLYGKLEEPRSVMLAPSQYDDVVKGNLQFSQFMQTLLISRTVLFIGSSLDGIQAYLKGMPLSRQNLRPHYALIPVTGEAWQAKANPLKERYGIEVLPYTPSLEHPEVQTFLEKLNALVNEEPERLEERSERESLLKKISVTDVGPFEKLELNFDPHWNILLGDNGVGKSSIIKAIAISILGEDARVYAHRLIKSGKPNSTIILETGRNLYTTNIFRRNGEARVESIPGRAFEAEGWLAIGFPPLRTMSWVRPTTTETYGRGRPKTEDLMPVVIGEADPRLDNLKKWIVNVDYWIKDARSREGNWQQFQRLLDDFFKVVSELTTGTKIVFKEVKAQTNEITIITDDGELPIEALSQGMTSLIGWVGILLQRLYEVYGTDEDDDPKQRYALVLMDEIDAHLHPAWQQTLIRKLSKIFPNVQFIATTHSPLIVGGMKPQQIIRFARDEDDRVVTYKVEEEMAIGRADQILSSDLFGLQSTMVLNVDLEEIKEQYHELLVKNRNEAEEIRFQQLRETLKSRIPSAGETPAEQKAMELIRALLQPDDDGAYSSMNEKTVKVAEELLNEVSKKRK
jgi:predicted ATPase